MIYKVDWFDNNDGWCCAFLGSRSKAERCLRDMQAEEFNCSDMGGIESAETPKTKKDWMDLMTQWCENARGDDE